MTNVGSALARALTAEDAAKTALYEAQAAHYVTTNDEVTAINAAAARYVYARRIVNKRCAEAAI